ncbi:MAG TPA: hypothetical protein VKG80_19525 [Trebonia sp.]|nr:hypothetical protein [Trebonia sp.]
MNTDVRRIADAVLYEGYILYPYRASAQKNRSRWQFGVLMPPAYAAADPYEKSMTQAECVFEHSGEPSVGVTVRFLQVQRRTLEEAADPAVPPVWDEAVEHEVTVVVPSAGLLAEPSVTEFAIPGGAEHETLAGARVARRREPLAGCVSVRATPLDGPWQAARLTVQVTNKTRPQSAGPMAREQALPAALVAAHMIITVSGGAFFSMTDPPEWVRPGVAACENIGCWPVLAGPPETRQVMLASPIILPDHPEVAAESPGELYDGTEIDEILTLRTLALSEEEKDAARATDPRAAALIDRVDAMDPQTMARLHGTIRTMRPPVPWWDPGADASVSPATDAVTVAGQRIARGSRVTLRPGARRADAQDMFLAGRPAIVEAVLFDVDDTAYLAVSLADAPDADLQAAHGRFLYFAPDEVEPAGEDG